VKFHLGDHLGSSHLVLNDTGAAINREEYTPYGETSFGSFAKKRYRFTGKERDEESGLSYHGARYYAPWLARWVSCDPAGTVDGLNLYRYARGNPVKFIDSNGNQSRGEDGAGGAGGSSPDDINNMGFGGGPHSSPEESHGLPGNKNLGVVADELVNQVGARILGYLEFSEDPGGAIFNVGEAISKRYQVYSSNPSETGPSAFVRAANEVLDPIAHAKQASDRADRMGATGNGEDALREQVKEITSLGDAALTLRGVAQGGTGGAVVSTKLAQGASTDLAVVRGSFNQVVRESASKLSQVTGQPVVHIGVRGNLRGIEEVTLVAHGVRFSGQQGASLINLGGKYGRVGPRKLAEILVNEQGWSGGTLRLVCCGTGIPNPGSLAFGETLAQELKSLGAPSVVIAPKGNASILHRVHGLPQVVKPQKNVFTKLGKGWAYFALD
jgi:RHS repeat-associated protein